MPGDDDALSIRANGRVLGMSLNSGRSVCHDLDPLRSAYLVVAAGSVTVNGEPVGSLDGVVITKESSIVIVATEDAELVMVDAG